MNINLKQLAFLLWMPIVFGQTKQEINPPNNIKSVIFKGITESQFPIILVDEPIHLEFDDLSANEPNYYYKIVHCNYNWAPSNLLKMQYLEGMDNQRITNYNNSFNTLQIYSHYKLTVPNEFVSLKLSGNYIMEIYNDEDRLQFSRRFVVYENLVRVDAVIKRSRNPAFLNTKQTVQFTVESGDCQLINPRTDLKVAILQNYYWSNALYNVQPQFILGSQLIYKYDKQTSFYAGNEYFNFDTSDIGKNVVPIERLDLKKLYNEYLYPNQYRYNRPYTYNPDIDGAFAIRNARAENSSIEADYTKVHFTLPYNTILGRSEVYIFGNFNNYELTPENKMILNKKTGNLESTLKLKQGFYNYKYVVKQDSNVDLNLISGNFSATENQYTVLVYYRKFGELYDSIIGIGSANSKNISD